jgi:hypothetical protein
MCFGRAEMWLAFILDWSLTSQRIVHSFNYSMRITFFCCTKSLKTLPEALRGWWSGTVGLSLRGFGWQHFSCLGAGSYYSSWDVTWCSGIWFSREVYLFVICERLKPLPACY